MIWVVLCFTLGICSLQLFSKLPNANFVVWVVGTGGLIGLLLVVTNFYLKKTVPHVNTNTPLRWKSYWQYPSLLKQGLTGILIFLLGFSFMWVQARWQLSHALPTSLENKPLVLQGKIDSIPDYSENNARFEFIITEPVEDWKDPGKISLFWPNPVQKPRMGEEWILTIKLKRPRGLSNPGGFDKEKHFFHHRWIAEGVVINKGKTQKISDQALSVLHRCRVAILEDLHSNLASRRYTALIAALVVGVTNGITKSQWAVFRETGTTHLMAISGLHVGFVAAFFYGVMSFIWRRVGCPFAIPAQWIAAWGGLIGAFGYALLAGLSVPTQRALIMLSLYFSSILLRRKTTAWRNYSIALGGVLLIDPFASLMPGFWLSFAAVGVILYGMQGRLNPQTIWWKWGRVQWVAFLGLLPLSLGFFQQVSWISPIVNLIAIPWVTFLVVPLALISILISPASDKLAQWLQILSENFLGLLYWILEFSAKLPKVSWVAEGKIGVLSLLAAFIGFLIFIAPRGFPGRFLGLVWCLPLFLARTPDLALGEFRFTLLDVGQGLAAVIETQHHLLVFDTGPKKTNWDAGEGVLLPFLRLNSHKKIDTLIISHGDLDHIGGMETLLNNFQVDQILSSEPEKIESDKARHCVAGKRWEWERVTFEMLHPTHLDTRKRNDHSCVLRVSTGQQSVLLTGDIEAKSEIELLERGKALAASVLVVPHHGSLSSSTETFIKAVGPSFALFPVGYHNPYGHPKQEVVQRYQTQGVTLLDSVCNGAITFLFKDKSDLGPPLLYRQQNQKFWQADFKVY